MKQSWSAAARANPLFRMVMFIAAGTLIVDQVTKLLVLHAIRLPERPFGHLDLSPVFDLTYVENTGVSFGLFAGGMTSRILLTLLALCVVAFVIHWAGRLDRRIAAIGAGFIVGGALGNAIDRTMYGYVVDFLDFTALYFPWKFNIADTAINLGVACLAYDAFFVAPKPKAAVTPDAPERPVARMADADDDETKPNETSRS
jgi:signal peptidase II